MDRDDEEDGEDESEESEAEEDEEQEKGESQNGIRRSQGMHSTVKRRADVGTMVNALQQEGETKAKLLKQSLQSVLCVFSCTLLLFSGKWQRGKCKIFTLHTLFFKVLVEPVLIILKSKPLKEIILTNVPRQQK